MPIHSWSSEQVGSFDARALVGAFLSVGVHELRSGLLLCPQNDQRYQSIAFWIPRQPRRPIHGLEVMCKVWLRF